jgi:hypothetical protein
LGGILGIYEGSREGEASGKEGEKEGGRKWRGDGRHSPCLDGFSFYAVTSALKSASNLKNIIM